jgi:hypothetical protein
MAIAIVTVAIVKPMENHSILISISFSFVMGVFLSD